MDCQTCEIHQFRLSLAAWRLLGAVLFNSDICPYPSTQLPHAGLSACNLGQHEQTGDPSSLGRRKGVHVNGPGYKFKRHATWKSRAEDMARASEVPVTALA